MARLCASGSLSLSLAIMFASGCSPEPGRPDLQSPDSARRALAARSVGERGDLSAIPLLVDRLDDDDEAVRFYSIHALDRLTGQRMGYLYYRPPGQQRDAIERWRAAVREGRFVAGGGTNGIPEPTGPTDGAGMNSGLGDAVAVSSEGSDGAETTDGGDLGAGPTGTERDVEASNMSGGGRE
jgi:hypothetical protein